MTKNGVWHNLNFLPYFWVWLNTSHKIMNGGSWFYPKILSKSRKWCHCPAHTALLTSARQKAVAEAEKVNLFSKMLWIYLFFSSNQGFSNLGLQTKPLVVQEGTASGSWVEEKQINSIKLIQKCKKIYNIFFFNKTNFNKTRKKVTYFSCLPAFLLANQLEDIECVKLLKY